MAISIRKITPNDMAKVREYHDKYYSEFAFPQFTQMEVAFIIEDEQEEIVMAGGVEAVGEAVLITNKEKSRIKIGKALVEAQRLSMFACKQVGIRDLYAFVKDDEYAEHLIQHGFSDCDRALSIRIR